MAYISSPEFNDSRKRRRLRSSRRGHWMRARVVHPIGHNNGGQTVGRQRDRADDAVSHMNNIFDKNEKISMTNVPGFIAYRLTLNVWRRWQAKKSRCQNKLNGKLPDAIVETLKHPKQWQLDYQLEDTGPLGLYQEYSEMGTHEQTYILNNNVVVSSEFSK